MRLKKFLDFPLNPLYTEPRVECMFKKLFGKTKKASSEDQPSEPKAPKPHKATTPSPRLLTAEGWKRLMMKKYRKSS